MAIITSTQMGDFDVGATWVGGVAPTSSDDAIIANLHVVTMTQPQTVNSMEIQAGGTLAGGGFLLTLVGEAATTLTFNHDGIISGVLNLKGTFAGLTAYDLRGSSGNVNNLEIDAVGGSHYLDNVSLNGNLIVTNGLCRASSNAETITIADNLYIASGTTFGHTAWTGKLTVGGDVSNFGTWLGNSAQVIVIGGMVYGPGAYPPGIEVPNIEYPADADKFADAFFWRDFNLQGD